MLCARQAGVSSFEAKLMTDQHILILNTCPEDVTAAKIATVLVEERLAACVNRVSRMASTYWWQGKLVTDTEALLMIKTTAALFERVSRRLHELHPYELPEVVALPFSQGSERYFGWLSQSVAPSGGTS
jgi:periplasmic divalent cation tolerance protein